MAFEASEEALLVLGQEECSERNSEALEEEQPSGVGPGISEIRTPTPSITE
jgi:hypothetical protein